MIVVVCPTDRTHQAMAGRGSKKHGMDNGGIEHVQGGRDTLRQQLGQARTRSTEGDASVPSDHHVVSRSNVDSETAPHSAYHVCDQIRRLVFDTATIRKKLCEVARQSIGWSNERVAW